MGLKIIVLSEVTPTQKKKTNHIFSSMWVLGNCFYICAVIWGECGLEVMKLERGLGKEEKR